MPGRSKSIVDNSERNQRTFRQGKRPGCFFDGYAAVLHTLNGMDKDLLLVAKDDELGRKLQDLELKTGKRAPRRS